MLCGVSVKLAVTVGALKEEVLRANPSLADRHPSQQLQLRFPGLKVDRPYSGTLLRHMNGLTSGSLVVCSWDLRPSAGRSSLLGGSLSSSARQELDAKDDELLADLLQRRLLFPVLVRFEFEQTIAFRGGATAGQLLATEQKWSECCLLVNGTECVRDLNRLVWDTYSAKCQAEYRFYGGNRGTRRSGCTFAAVDLNFYVCERSGDSVNLHWRPVDTGVPLSDLLNFEAHDAMKLPAKLIVTEELGRVSGLVASASATRLICGLCDDLFCEARNFPIGPWGADIERVALPTLDLPLDVRCVEAPGLNVRMVTGELLLSVSCDEASRTSVGALKEMIRARYGWDAYRQKFITGGRSLDDLDLLPLPNGSANVEVTVVLGPGHPAAVSINGVYFGRTKREHAGKPVYHGHMRGGAPCEVVWVPELGWLLRPVDPATAHMEFIRPSIVLGFFDRADVMPLGTQTMLADVEGGSLLRLDAGRPSR